MLLSRSSGVNDRSRFGDLRLLEDDFTIDLDLPSLLGLPEQLFLSTVACLGMFLHYLPFPLPPRIHGVGLGAEDPLPLPELALPE